MNKFVGGILLMLVSLFMLMGFFQANLQVGFIPLLLTFVISVVLPGAGGVYFIHSHFREKKLLVGRKEHLKLKTLEAEILHLAGQRAGQLTLTEVVSTTAMDSDTVEKALESLAAKGLSDINVTDEGTIIYIFPEMQSAEDARNMKGLLDD